MSTFTYPVQIGDPAGNRFEQISARVDTGATYTVIPRDLLHRLGVPPLTRREFEFADGNIQELEIGETRIKALDRTATRIVVFGAENSTPLLGADTLEGLALAADPVAEKLVPPALS